VRSLIIVLCLSGVLGCSTIENPKPRVIALAQKMQDIWKAENPGKPLTLEVDQKILADAETQVAEEIKRDRSEAGEKAAEIAVNLATGNYVAGGIGLLGLIGLALGIYGRGKQIQKKPEA
jgi:hypothetical protein